jgi:hypothetical protein
LLLGAQPGRAVFLLMTLEESLPGVDLGIPASEVVRSNAVYLYEVVVQGRDASSISASAGRMKGPLGPFAGYSASSAPYAPRGVVGMVIRHGGAPPR